jgi:hypothetical protein
MMSLSGRRLQRDQELLHQLTVLEAVEVLMEAVEAVMAAQAMAAIVAE